MSNSPYTVLFLCTGNSARSILAEYITRQYFSEKFNAFSAGSHPKEAPNPVALQILHEEFQIDCSDAHSKSWDQFLGQKIDFVITLCDDAKESCPVWPGQPVMAHWGMKDPSDVPEAEKPRAFLRTAQVLKYRMELLSNLPIAKLDRLKLEQETRDIRNAHPGEAS
ncbi:MAG: arsenate reductase ArsC [Kiritimatiellia bacterium]